MSFALYNSLLEKWRDFLSRGYGGIAWDSLMTESDCVDLYDGLADDFCKEHKYSDKTKEFAFHGQWYDTFKDEFYKKLNDEVVKIIHSEPLKGDWDFGKKFVFIKGHWNEKEILGKKKVRCVLDE